jgi:hypothetical protein
VVEIAAGVAAHALAKAEPPQQCRFYSCHVPPVRATLDGDHL